MAAESPDRSQTLKAAGAMGSAVFLSRILGLAREQAFAYLFGAGTATDAFNVAFRIPNLLRDLFAEGAMSASLVPVFTRVRAEEGDRRAWRVAGLVFRALFVIVSALAAVGILAAGPLVDLYAGAYAQVPGKRELTVLMTRIMFPFFPLVALAAAYMAVLNACGRFFLPAFASALFNLVSVAVGAGLAVAAFPSAGIEPVVGMAVGVVLGGAVQAFCQLPQLRESGYRWQGRAPEDPAWHRDPALRRMLALLLPGMAGLAATQVNVLVNTVLATSQGEGAVSWLNYAFRLMQFPIGIFGVSLAAATLPRVSALWVKGDARSAGGELESSLRRSFAVNIPAAAGLAFLGEPVVQLLFEYGKFTPESTLRTAHALAAYAVGLPAYSAVKILVPACYAVGVTKAAVISSVVSVAFTVAANLLLIGPLGYVGLALGTSVAAVLNLGILWLVLRRRLGGAGGELPAWGVLRSAAAYLCTALAMGWLCRETAIWLAVMAPFEEWPAALGRTLRVSAVVVEGVVVTAILARMLGLREMVEAIDFFGSRVKKKLRRPGR